MKRVYSVLLILFVIFIVSCGGDKVSVTFDYDYDQKTEVVSVKRGDKVAEPQNVSRDGYILDDWFLSGSSYDFNTPVTENIVLVAQWILSTNARENLLADLAKVKAQFDNTVVEDIKLAFPSRGENGSRFSYSSSNPGIITTNGYIISPSKDVGDTTVTITVSGTLGSFRESETISFIVPAVSYSENVTKSVDLDFENTSPEFSVAKDTLRTYYVDNGALPYADAEDFISLLGVKSSDDSDNDLNPLFYSDEIEYVLNDQILTIMYSVEYDNDSEEFQMVIDFLNNTITIDSFDFFDGYIQSTGTDYADKLSYLPSYSEAGNQVVFDLDRYNIDIFIYNDNGETQFLLPFHLVNLLFTYGTYYNVYYNVDQYYGIYAYPEGDTLSTIKTSSVTNSALPYDISLATYHFTAFTFDYLYGLKDIKGVDTYYDLLANYTDQLLATNSQLVSNAIYEFIYKTVDELHSSFTFYGHYVDSAATPPPAYINDSAIRGSYVLGWSKSYISIDSAYKKAFPNGSPIYRIIDDTTAIIYLDSFDTATIDNPGSADSDRHMERALNEIFNNNPNIENIVLDISQNGGGNIGALFRVLGYMTEEPIEVSYLNPTDGSKLTYFVEVSTTAYDVNWYVLTSQITFSAANLLTAIAKNQGFATIIGTPSFGGASSITPIILPDGTMISISSLNVLSVRVDNGDGTYTYNHIEYGIKPDYVVNIPYLYNDAYIIQAINETK